jgi:hypothetical protein
VNYGFLCGRTAEPAKGAATILNACRKYALIYNERKTINPGAPLLAGCDQRRVRQTCLRMISILSR